MQFEVVRKPPATVVEYLAQTAHVSRSRWVDDLPVGRPPHIPHLHPSAVGSNGAGIARQPICAEQKIIKRSDAHR
jgi:hypothetical protein